MNVNYGLMIACQFRVKTPTSSQDPCLFFRHSLIGRNGGDREKNVYTAQDKVKDGNQPKEKKNTQLSNKTGY